MRAFIWRFFFLVTEPKASSVHNYYIVHFTTGVPPDVLYYCIGQPPQTTSFPIFFSSANKLPLLFTLIFLWLFALSKWKFKCCSQICCMKIPVEILLYARGWFPSTSLLVFTVFLLPFPQRRCFFSINSHKRQ